MTKFFDQPIIPVAAIERAEDAAPIAQALQAGGLNTMELTLRTPAALD
ncbi:MAG: keto-deoxy-phosphogluconate aldolase, partial [Kiritimatiellia bacterium]